jgi:putative intracellular protease/amidase
MSMTSVLIVLSAAEKWTRTDGSTYESGVWAEEFVVLDETLVKAGFRVDIATQGGVAPTIDARSLNPEIVGEDHAAHFRDYLASNATGVERPLILALIDAGRYDAIVIPGGHGPVEDLYKDPDMGRLLVQANRASKVIASVCHGPFE